MWLMMLTAVVACRQTAPETAEPQLPDPTVSSNLSSTLAPTATPLPAELTLLQDVNIRSGPGIDYSILGLLAAGTRLPISGRAADNSWWLVACPADIVNEQCWISGDVTLTQATNAAGVPIAQTPPTPVPVATIDPLLTTPLLAYLENGDVWLLPLVDDGTLFNRASAPLPLSQGAQADSLAFSPNGQWLLFWNRGAGTSRMDVVSRDGRESVALVDVAAMTPLPESYGAVSRWVDQVAWFPDSSGIIFNTAISAQQGPGLGPLADLWTVSLDGELEQRLEPGLGGGRFALSPTMPMVVLSAPMELLRVNLDGSGREVLITHAAVITYSEYTYFADVQWTAAGESAHVAISSPDPVFGEAYAQIWQIENGVATEQQRLIGNILFNRPQWTAAGTRMAYVQQVVAESNPPKQLIIANGDGSDQRPYGAPGAGIELFGWNPAGSHLIYSDGQTAFLGILGAEPLVLSLPTAAQLTAAQWVTEAQFILTAAEEGTTTVYSGHINGDLVALLTVPQSALVMDVWVSN